MKKIIFTATAVLSALFLVSSCGSSKKAATSLGVEEMKSPAQTYAEEAPKGVQRAWASFNDFDGTVAVRGASALARGELATQISTYVKQAIDIYRSKYLQNVTDSKRDYRQVADGEGKSSDQVQSIASEVVKGSRVVKSNTYVQKDNTRTAYVCVEIDVDLIIEDIKNDQRIEKLISDDDKLKIDFDRERFADEMKALFDEYKEQREE